VGVLGGESGVRRRSGLDTFDGASRCRVGGITLGPGQLYVVPRGVQHQPVSTDGAEVVLIEPSATVNTGDTPSQLTAERRRG